MPCHNRCICGAWCLSKNKQKVSFQNQEQKVCARKQKNTCVCVEMVPQQGDCPEGAPTQMALVRPLIRVALHVTVEVGASWAGVATQLALECLLHTWTSTHCKSIPKRPKEVLFFLFTSTHIHIQPLHRNALPFFLILVGFGGFMLPTTFSALTSESRPSCCSSSKS